ncbi:MAG: LamG-like jellyroll fold domain-containing protein, partial [Anaerolineae bacterium]
MKRLIFFGFLVMLLGGVLGQAGAVPLQNEGGNWAANTPQSNRFLSLNGTDQYVEIPHDPALNPTGAFTIEAWVKRASGSRCETIISKGYTSAYWLGFCSGAIRFYASGNAPGDRQDGNTAIPADVWTHIAVVYQGSGRRYYVNGELDYQGGPELAPTTNSLPVWIGSDPGGCCDFQGQIANVRLWNVARTQNEIRRTMHQAFTAPRSGLVANWRFSEGFEDNVGGFDGTAVNGAVVDSDYAFPPPPQAAPIPLDEGFNLLAGGLRYNGIATIPRLNRALAVGGQYCSSCIRRTEISSISAATGEEVVLDNLPVATMRGTAVYAPVQDKVYYFGGTTTSSGSSPQDTIYAIDPISGAPATLSVTLPQPLSALTAVYHPGRDKVLLLGGRDGVNAIDSIAIFDPAAQTIITSTSFILPEPLASVGAVYSGPTDSVYLFGGKGTTESDKIYQITLNNAGDGGSVTLLPTRLPLPVKYLQAVNDKDANLIYLSSGYGSSGNSQKSIWIFDPVTNDLWDTHIFPSGNMTGMTGFYAPRQRHVVYIGGYTSPSWREVWRLPVGDGPLVPLGRWD